MRASPWFPVLLLLALGAYLIPAAQPTFDLGVQPSVSAGLPNALPEETRALFERSRPATVRVESVDPGTRAAGVGTGFFIGASGQVLTAYHVVSGGTLFQVNTLSGQAFPATLRAFDAQADVALLEVRGGGPFPFLKVASRAPRVGETVLAIGNSDGDFLQPRRGQLLNLGVEAGRADFPQGTLEMNAPLAPGDSGGPVIDGNGQAIGVISFIRVDDSGQTRRSYAVPVVEGNALLTALRAGEKRDVAVLGLVLDSVHSGRLQPQGAVVAQVARRSPAALAGLRGAQYGRDGELVALGDVVTSVNGTRVRSADEYLTLVRGLAVGDVVVVTYSRDGEELEARMTLVAKATLPDLRE